MSAWASPTYWYTSCGRERHARGERGEHIRYDTHTYTLDGNLSKLHGDCDFYSTQKTSADFDKQKAFADFYDDIAGSGALMLTVNRRIFPGLMPALNSERKFVTRTNTSPAPRLRLHQQLARSMKWARGSKRRSTSNRAIGQWCYWSCKSSWT